MAMLVTLAFTNPALQAKAEEILAIFSKDIETGADACFVLPQADIADEDYHALKQYIADINKQDYNDEPVFTLYKG